MTNQVTKTKNNDDQISNSTKQNTSNIKWFEVLFLVCNVLVVTLLFFISKEKNYLSSLCSFVGCFAMWFLAKGFFFAPAVNVVFDILYIILSYFQNYFGEAIIYLLITLPIDIYSTFSWRKNNTLYIKFI